MGTLSIAAVNPRTVFGEGSRTANLATARASVIEAVGRGAELVVFPETFPGAWRRPVDWTPEIELASLAAEFAIFIVGGFAEPIDAAGDRAYNTVALFGPSGDEIGRYRRTTPAQTPWVYAGGHYWDFDWVNSEPLPVFDTPFGKIGLLVCSEVYAPELARILALKGAEVICMPAGLISPSQNMFLTWKTLGWARSIENLAGTVVCSNVVDGGGLAMVCSPEQILVESQDPGVHMATLDIDRLRWLRSEVDRRVEPGTHDRPWGTKPGTLRDWRRPEVFAANPELTAAPSEIDPAARGEIGTSA